MPCAPVRASGILPRVVASSEPGTSSGVGRGSSTASGMTHGRASPAKLVFLLLILWIFDLILVGLLS